MSSSNCCFLTCIQVSQEAGQVVWNSHLFQNFPQFIVIHTVKGFGIVNKAEIDVFLELFAFSMIQHFSIIPIEKSEWTFWPTQYIGKRLFKEKTLIVFCGVYNICRNKKYQSNRRWKNTIAELLYYRQYVMVLSAGRVAKSRTRLREFTFTFHFHALEKEMATHSSVLAWRIPGTAEPGGLPSMGLHRVGHD